jgi:HAMP domain-containing protein
LLSLALGWVLAGRNLRPLRAIIGTARDISARNLHERLAIRGPRDEFTERGDILDGLRP